MATEALNPAKLGGRVQRAAEEGDSCVMDLQSRLEGRKL